MAQTWSEYRGSTSAFQFPWNHNGSTTTNYYVYKVSMERQTLKVLAQVEFDVNKGAYTYDKVSAGLKINYYDKNGSFIGDDWFIPVHDIYYGEDYGTPASVWDSGKGWGVTYSGSAPTFVVPTNAAGIDDYLRSRGLTPNGTNPASEPFFTRYITDDSSYKYPPQSNHKSWYPKPSIRPINPNPAPKEYTITVPKNAAYFNFTIYGYGPFIGAKTFDFPSKPDASTNDNFLLDPYTKGYIKRGSWEDEPYFWHKLPQNTGGDDNRGWEKIYGYIRDGIWKEI